jgi:hypothetical protein
MYLFHFVTRALLDEREPVRQDFWDYVFGTLVGSFALATAGYFLIEKPFGILTRFLCNLVDRLGSGKHQSTTLPLIGPILRKTSKAKRTFFAFMMLVVFTLLINAGLR